MNFLPIVCLLFAGIIVAEGHGGFERPWSSHGHGFDQESIELRNKRTTLVFYQEVFGDKNVDAADKYISAKTYIQHNPEVPDGLVPFKKALKGWFAGVPREIVDIKRISADGDLVWIHVRQVEQGTLKAVVDIFRFNDEGKIVEHWDVIQEVLKTAANSHPMF